MDQTSFDDSVIYYDVRIDNQYVDSYKEKTATTSFTTSEILDKQSDYKVAVDFYNIRASIPVFIMPILLGNNSDINATTFGVCLSYGADDYPERVMYYPTDEIGQDFIYPRPPSQNNGYQDFRGLYYFVWFIQHFIDLINETFQKSFDALKAQHPGFAATEAPWLQYDTTTKLVSLVVPNEYKNDPDVRVWINIPLQDYFDGIKCFLKFETNAGSPVFKDYEFDITNFKNNNAYALKGQTIPAPPLEPDYLIYTQEYGNLWKWCNIRSLLFKSNTIKTRPEYMPPVTNNNSLVTRNINVFNPNTSNILSYYDFVVGANDIDWKQNLYYQPAYRRWLDLVSDEPLNRIDIEISIQLNSGEIIPLYIGTNQVIDLKLVFKKHKGKK